MSTLILLVGLPACGKSTYANKLKDKAVILSSDAIRKELWGDENDQRELNVVFDTLYSRARQNLIDGKDVVIDATNVLKEDRARALKHFVDLDIRRVAIVFNTPIEICKKRNKERKRVVPEYVIERFAKQYIEPTKDEGFDEIIYID